MALDNSKDRAVSTVEAVRVVRVVKVGKAGRVVVREREAAGHNLNPTN